MANANQEPTQWPTGTRTDPKTGAYLASPKQLLRIYHAYLNAGLIDTTRLTDIANQFTHPDSQVTHWMDIWSTTASKWIDAIQKAEHNQAMKRRTNEYDPERHSE